MANAKSISDVAKELADEHRREDPETESVYLAEALDEVRLVEVTDAVGTTNEVLPFRFAAQPQLGIDYPSVVVLVSRQEWADLVAGRLNLPKGWGKPAELKKIA